MRPTVSQYAAALEELVSSQASSDITQTVKNFFAVLRQRGDTGKVEAVLAALEARAAEKEGRVPVTVVTAHETDTETKAVLSQKIEALFPDKKVELHFEIDRAVIGGALFRTDEILYDGTLRAEIRALKQLLIKA